MADGRVVDRVTWVACGAMAVAIAAWIALTDFTFRLSSLLMPLACGAGFGLAAFVYTHWRPDERMAAVLTALVQLIAFTAVAAPLSYLLASLGLPFWDETLHRWDLALGLDWQALIAWANAHPTVTLWLSLSYGTLMPQMLALVVLLGLSGRLRQLRIVVGAITLTGAITIVISGLMPAMAMFVHSGLTAADFPNISPMAAFVHVKPIQMLRDGGLRELVALAFEGIITFPSYHAALAVVFMRAFWSLRWLRWPGLALNVAMIAATPIDGGHHFVDVLAGIGTAVLVLAVLERVASLPSAQRRAALSPPLRAAPQAA